MNKKQNRKRQAGTAHDSSTNDDNLTSSQPIANTHVVRSQSPTEIEETENYIRLLEWLSLIGWLLVIVLIFG